ncbi:MAG: hypothetical protein IKK15_04475, partial [Akkermansia sp.]|nr:hypothetical protein [Akkermansia sp.]
CRCYHPYARVGGAQRGLKHLPDSSSLSGFITAVPTLNKMSNCKLAVKNVLAVHISPVKNVVSA